MNALIVLLITLTALGAYITIGVRFAARPYVTREVERQCRTLPTLAKDTHTIERWRRTAAHEGLFVALIWPIALTIRHLGGALAASAPLSQAELKQQIQQRDRRIADLEREVGIR